MNRYPLWKYAVMLVALAIGLLYTLPNFFGEAPAVQVSSGKATVKLDSATLSQVEAALAASAVSTADSVVESSLTVALPLDTCTAGASPNRLGSVYTRPMTRATSITAYFQRG